MKFDAACCVFVLFLSSVSIRASAPLPAGPSELRVDNLIEPLGIDDPAPSFSWQMQDPSRAALQTAYELSVATTPQLLDHPDIWAGGRVVSAQSQNVPYAGAPLKPSTRYYWRVRLWGAKDKEYPVSKTSWFETGLLTQQAWHSAPPSSGAPEWIGYETREESAIRHSPAAWITNPDQPVAAIANAPPERFAFRTAVTIDKPVKNAVLYATGEDAVSVWINGMPVLEAGPFPPWRQMPWKKFLRVDVTERVTTGSNLIALESVLYSTTSAALGGAPPVIATLYVVYADETTAEFSTNPRWKAAAHPASGWQQKAFDDSSWKSAAGWEQKDPAAAPLGHPWIPDSVKALRREFSVSSPIKSARLYSTALGTYEVFLNGKRVSEDMFAPGWTDYRERVTYQTYDVTTLLSHGKNAIGALLAPGWYSTSLEWFEQPNNYGDTPPAFRAQLRMEHVDGSVEWLVSDRQWQAHTSSILHSELYDGESQDARTIQTGWSTAAFASSDWPAAETIQPRPVEIVAQNFQPIRVERSVPALAVTQPQPGIAIFDFGQNLAGVEHLRISGPAGTDVRIRFGEILNADGTLYTDNLRNAKATDHFILAGKGVEEFTPQFTFHGFRYAEVTGLPATPRKDALTALAVHTSAPITAIASAGAPMVNQLLSNILWGQRSNFVGVPTDCPQRDERLGWMADAQVFWRTASYNMDLAAFSRKFSTDMRGTQAGTSMYGIYAPGTVRENMGFGPGWSDAGVIIPWTSWLQTGDTRIITENWDAMAKYVDAIAAANPEGLWKNEPGIAFGDWLSPEGRTDQVLIATSSWAYDATLLSQMAHAIGRSADEEKYRQLFERIKAAFQKQFVHDDGFIAGADSRGSSPFGERTHPTSDSVKDTQTGYVVALHMNLLPDNLRAAAAQKLVDKIQANHGLLATGFLGTPYLLEELTKTGHADVAYQLLLNTQYPSWGYLIEHGATTTWERWNGDAMKSDPSMNSYNHYAYGAVADWIYRYAAGIDATPLDAGFHSVVLHPQFDQRLGSIDLTYRSTYGDIHSAWTMRDGVATWKVTIPANTTGWLDTDAMANAQFRLEGKPITASTSVRARTRDGHPGYELQSGSYVFTVSK